MADPTPPSSGIHRFFASLRLRLLLLVLLSLLPVAGLVLYAGWEQQRVALADSQGHLLRLARLAAGRQAQYTEEIRHLLVTWSHLPQLQEDAADACPSLLADLLRHYPMLANIGVIAPDGIIRCSALPVAGAVNASDREYFRRAVETRDFAVGVYQIGRITGKATVNFGYPLIAKGGHMTAVLFAALDLSALDRLAGDVQLPADGRLFLLDRHGMMLMRHPDPERLTGHSFADHPAVQTILAKQEGVVQAVGLDGVARLIAFASVASTSATPAAYVGATLPVETVVATAHRHLQQTLTWLVLMGLLALAAAGLFSERLILRPGAALMEASRRLAAGDLSARTSVPRGTGEMHELARAFNEMAESIQQRVLERERMQRDITRLAAFPELYPNPMIEADTAGLVTYRNPAARAQFPDLATLGFGHPILHDLTDVVSELRLRQQSSFIREITVGGIIYEQQIYLIAESTLIHLYMLDVTDRKRAERERNLAYQQLKDAQVQLIQTERLASVGQLSAGIAHELKNPLAIIQQGVTFLEITPHASVEQRAEVVAMTKKAVVRADTIIRNLLTFTRQTPAQRQPVNIHDVIATALVLVEKQLTVGGVTVVKTFAADPALIPADPNQMEQIFINLIMNALQAMPQGGQLTLKTYRQALTTLGQGVGRRAEDFFALGQEALICEVTDTGSGIAEEDLDKVFDPFFTTKPAGEGTGLGLSTVQSIVDAHRGLINIDSHVGRGTTVRMTFPVVPREGDPPAATA